MGVQVLGGPWKSKGGLSSAGSFVAQKMLKLLGVRLISTRLLGTWQVCLIV